MARRPSEEDAVKEAEARQTRSKSPRILLYTQPTNPFSEKVALALALKKQPFERVLSENPEDIRRWSPIERTLPVLEIDGRRMADSTRIVEWIDELYPEPPLFARDPKVAEAQRNLAEWSEKSFLWYWNRWRTARFPQPGDDAPIDQPLIKKIVGRVGRHIGQSPSSRADAREVEVIAEIQDRLTDLEGFLGGRPYFHSDQPSIADISVFAMLRILRDGPIPHTRAAIDERPALAAFVRRMEEHVGQYERADTDWD